MSGPDLCLELSDQHWPHGSGIASVVFGRTGLYGPCPPVVTRMDHMEQDNGKNREHAPASEPGTKRDSWRNSIDGSGNGPDRLTNGDSRRPGRHRDVSAYRTTEDEQLLNRAMPEEPVPRSAELGTFTHTDPWRVLRIQGEFVHGINALADVGAAVTVFGSARFGEIASLCTSRPGSSAGCSPRPASP